MCWGSMVHKLVLRYKVTNWKSSLTNTCLLLESLSMGSTLYSSHFQDPQHPGTLKPGGGPCALLITLISFGTWIGFWIFQTHFSSVLSLESQPKGNSWGNGDQIIFPCSHDSLTVPHRQGSNAEEPCGRDLRETASDLGSKKTAGGRGAVLAEEPECHR